jgi:glycopeptide antibiotics resistance protein
MKGFVTPLITALTVFPFVAAALTVPFLLYQYRKYRYFNKLRAAVLYTFILYILCATFLVLLPLPETRDVASTQKPGTQYWQLVPFTFAADVVRETGWKANDPASWLRLFTERAFLQAFFNLLLLMPLGFFLRYHRKWRLSTTVAAGFALSLAFELTQLTALFGYYNAPWRIFDVDDLLLNTLGAGLGWLASRPLVDHLPHSEQLDAKTDPNRRPVGFVRRGLALAVDLPAWLLLTMVFGAVLSLGLKDNELVGHLALLAAGFVYFVVGQKGKHRATWGKWLVRLRLKARKGPVTWRALSLRYGLLWAAVPGAILLLSRLGSLWEDPEMANVSGLLLLAWLGFLGVYGFVKLFSRDKLLMHEHVSGLRNRVA